MKKNLLLSLSIALQISVFAGGGDPPFADYSYYIEFIGVGSEVSFLNESTGADTYYWDFGDGGYSTDLNPVHSYPEPGIFIVCLTAYNEFGSDTYCDTLVTYYAPSADFAFIGDPTVTFTDLSTNYPLSWDWFFGDDSTSNIQNPVHTYLANGEYSVCLSVSNPGGTNYTCKPVVISSYATTEALFSFSGDPDVLFTDLSSFTPTEWFWEFGDDSTSTEQNPEHIYLDNGVFNVCLTATNAGGMDTYCEDVTIIYAIAAPVADFSFVTIGLEAAFVDLSTNDPFAWSWDFDDGNSSVEQNPVHVYSEDGNYNVCLTATNEGGDNTICKDVSAETAIGEIYLSDVMMYPNPSSDLITIKLKEGIQPELIKTFNNEGEIIDLIFNVMLTAQTSNLPDGIYYTVVYSDGKVLNFSWSQAGH